MNNKTNCKKKKKNVFQSRGNGKKERVTVPAEVKESLVEIILELHHENEQDWGRWQAKRVDEERNNCVPDEKGTCILTSPKYRVVKACSILETAWNSALLMYRKKEG